MRIGQGNGVIYTYRKYDFIEDPGHGWLEVNLTELIELELTDKISSWSFISKNGKVYLEEDSDAHIFLDAKGLTRKDVNTIYYNDDCFVRELEHFNGHD